MRQGNFCVNEFTCKTMEFEITAECSGKKKNPEAGRSRGCHTYSFSVPTATSENGVSYSRQGEYEDMV